MKSNKKFMNNIVIQERNSSLHPDYIDGVVTEPNENPVILEYNYKRHGSFNVSEVPPIEFARLFIGSLFKHLLTGMGIGIIGGSKAAATVAGIGYWIGEAGLATAIEMVAEQITIEGSVSGLFEAFQAWIGPQILTVLNPVLLVLIAGVIIYVGGEYDSIVFNNYKKWRELGLEGKKRVDTEGYYDDKGKWHYTWAGFKIRMSYRFKMISRTIRSTEFMYDRNGRYIEVTAGSPPAYFGSNKELQWYEVLEEPYIELIPEEE